MRTPLEIAEAVFPEDQFEAVPRPLEYRLFGPHNYPAGGTVMDATIPADQQHGHAWLL